MNDAPSQTPPSTASSSQSQPGKFIWWWRWFWRVTLVVSLGYAWYCFYVPANNITWAKDYDSALQQAAQSGKPMIFFFTTKWCVPCRIMKRNVWADEQVETVVNAGFTPVMIDLNDPNTAAALSRYRIVATPTTIITDLQGNILKRAEGGIGKADFLELLGGLNPDGSKDSIPLSK